MLGAKLHHLVNNICPHYHTKELTGEEAAHGRHRAAKSAKATNQPATQVGTAVSTQNRVQGPKRKLLNLCMYKLHALGDYVLQILWFETTDSYSTQTGELQHCRVKRFYAQTNKNGTNIQIAYLQRHEELLQHKQAQVHKHPLSKKAQAKVQAALAQDESEPLAYTPPKDHHHISHSCNFTLKLVPFLREHATSLAIIVGILSYTMHWQSFTSEYRASERNSKTIC
ncbi:hypothetical protein PHLCEN_2v1066 [Hermanssonia centrifuga]|uniref:Uncharacterized protein n=1 Tax=Hermanssonia centrifuga TaxID=98765 RepID=A0A2R6S472_9APHY|nr:hypothetical protein PHLCEN_2v1066 [Hermanssonia centrifuga]